LLRARRFRVTAPAGAAAHPRRQIYPLSPLSLPRTTPRSIPRGGALSAVRLFVERARQQRPDFELTRNAARCEICRQLDAFRSPSSWPPHDAGPPVGEIALRSTDRSAC